MSLGVRLVYIRKYSCDFYVKVWQFNFIGVFLFSRSDTHSVKVWTFAAVCAVDCSEQCKYEVCPTYSQSTSCLYSEYIGSTCIYHIWDSNYDSVSILAHHENYSGTTCKLYANYSLHICICWLLLTNTPIGRGHAFPEFWSTRPSFFPYKPSVNLLCWIQFASELSFTLTASHTFSILIVNCQLDWESS